MKVFFSNPGAFELDGIRIMGLSVKLGENPIGRFGTGVCYGIATLLRTGHKVSLIVNDKVIEFTSRTKIFRGKEFEAVYMDDEQLGFTTQLGRDWEVWQAYRELASNCLDEVGEISDHWIPNDTVWVIEGQGIVEAHAMRNEIFISSKPWKIQDGVEIHLGQSKYIYYRGIRAHTLANPTIYTYNFIEEMSLTEDRTLSSTYDIEWKLGSIIPRVEDLDFAQNILNPDFTFYENGFDFNLCYAPCPQFLDVAEKYRFHDSFNKSAGILLKTARDITSYKHLVMTDDQVNRLDKISSVLMMQFPSLNISDIQVVEYIRPEEHITSDKNKIYITPKFFEYPEKQQMILMYRHVVCFVHKVRNNSTEMMNAIIEVSVNMMLRNKGDEEC